MPFFLPLLEIPASLRDQIGGKAAPLVELCELGLPVPTAFILPATSFREHLLSAKISPHLNAFYGDPSIENAALLRDALRREPLGQPLQKELITCVQKLGGMVAIRSSSLGEDGRAKSFAGQHLTELHVSPERASQALRNCWASLFSESAVAYRNGSFPRDAAMAVVVQRQIDPVASGVLFTTNPMNGSWRELVVEATWGLGEGLVSGHINPHWYLVRRPRKTPSPVQRIAARIRLDVLQEDLPEIPRYLVFQEDSVTWTDTPLRLRGRPTLERRQLFRLCRLGLRVESLRGGPQDLEWCLDHDGRLHILQARPITTTTALPVRRDVLWTRRFIGERWPEPATPMGWSILAPILNWFIGYPRTQKRYLGGGPSLRLVNYHPYINATVFRHLLFKTPGVPPLRFLLDMIPAEEERAWRNRFSARPSLNVYGSLLRETIKERRWTRFAWNPLTNHREWDRFKTKLDTHLPSLQRQARSSADAIGLLEQHEQWIRD